MKLAQNTRVTLAFGMSLALAACGGSSTSNGTSGSGSAATSAAAAAAAGGGSGGSPVCSAVERDYPLLLAGKLPIAPTGGNQWDAFSYALGQVMPAGEIPTGTGSDVLNLQVDAEAISDDLSQSAAGPKDYQQFDSDLQTVAKDCGTAFQPLPKSLTSAT